MTQAGTYYFVAQAVDGHATDYKNNQNKPAMENMTAYGGRANVNITFPAQNAVFKQGLDIIVKGTVSGIACPATVSVYVSGMLIGTCTSDSSGNWKFNGWNSSNASRGTYTIRASVNNGTDSGSGTVKVRLFQMICPVPGDIVTSPFGPRNGGFHHGVDYHAPYGTVVTTPEMGTIVQEYFIGVNGYQVVVDHGTVYKALLNPNTTPYQQVTLRTLFAHLIKDSWPPVGMQLSYTSSIGQADHTVGEGYRIPISHLHVQLWENGVLEDPTIWIP
jgi:murein DD-endopeptidase MepM/ murein hydrolase activator NlpD